MGTRIEMPNGSTWARLSDAKRLVHNCPDATALWVLNKHGKLVELAKQPCG